LVTWTLNGDRNVSGFIKNIFICVSYGFGTTRGQFSFFEGIIPLILVNMMSTSNCLEMASV